MKTKLVPVLLLVLLAGCAGGLNPRKSLTVLNTTRDAYNLGQNAAKAAHDSGQIPTNVWNQQVVPVDNITHEAIDDAYQALEVWVGSGKDSDLQTFIAAAGKAVEAFHRWQKLIGGLE